MNQLRWPLIFLSLLGITGCPATPPPAAVSTVHIGQIGELDAQRSSNGTETQPSSADNYQDPGPAVVSLNVYQLTVPLGSISRSEEFWKRVEEVPAIDVGTYDLLLKNDVRVGIGDNKDWPFFKSLIEKNHAAVVRGSSSVTAQGSLQLPLKTRIPSQIVSWTTDRDILFMRDFDDCENLLSISFEPAPRLKDHAILCVCPLVRGERKIVRFTPLNHEEPAFTQVYPEQIMSLAVKTDVPPDHFMIMAPTADTRLEMSVGRTFFVSNGVAEPLETVLILAPRVIHLTPER